MKEAKELVRIIESIPDEKRRELVYRVVWAFIDGTDETREEIVKAAKPGITNLELKNLIERVA